MSDTHTSIPQLNLLNLPQLEAIKQQIDSLIKEGGAEPVHLPANVNLAQLADINKQLEAFVQLASTVLPILSTFVPQLKVLIPILPVLTGLLKIGDDIAQAGNDPAEIADALVAHLKDVAQQVQALKLSPQAKSSPRALGSIIDTNENTTGGLSALKAAGIGTVIRYVARSQAASHNKVLITPVEARAIAAAGINLGLVFETDGHPSGTSTGNIDGQAALTTAAQCGAPKGACIYYAVDYDAPSADMPGIIAAFTAFKSVVFPTYTIGCYGSGFVNGQLFDAGLIKYRWITQSLGFAGSRAAIAAGQYELLQKLPQRIAGLDCDPNVPREPNLDIGVFVPFGTLPTEPTFTGFQTTSSPPWLALMQQITGTKETSGSADNPVILGWAAEIGKRYPEMASYCSKYDHDSKPWCGLTVAYCMAMAGIRPQFGATDEDRFLWADSWRQFGVPVTNPQPGDVLVYQWPNGSHHVSLYDHETPGDQYASRGGNQGDAVTVAMYGMSSCTAIRRPA
jgi:uncharacterized protein (TIGR02594 family)